MTPPKSLKNNAQLAKELLQEFKTPGGEPLRVLPDYYDRQKQAMIELELQILKTFMSGKRIKEMCKPLKMSAKKIEDVMRSGLNRRAQQSMIDT